MKRLMAIIAAALIMAGGFVQVAQAEEMYAKVSGVEPTLNTDGSLITDLALIRVYYYQEVSVLGGDAPAAATMQMEEYPASSPTGGLPFERDIAIMVPTCKVQTYRFHATAVTSDGRESENSTTGSKTFASALPCPKPNAPAQFMILPDKQANQFNQ